MDTANGPFSTKYCSTATDAMSSGSARLVEQLAVLGRILVVVGAAAGGEKVSESRKDRKRGE